MSEKLHLTSAQRREEEINRLHEQESGYDVAQHIPRGMSASEALEEIEKAQGLKEPTVEELRAQRHARLTEELGSELKQEQELNPAMAMAFKDAGLAD